MVRVSGVDGPGPGKPPKVDPWGAIVGKVKSFWKSLGFFDDDAPSVQETADYVDELGDNLQPAVDVLTVPIPGGSLLNPGASGGQKALDVGLSVLPGVGFIDDAGRLVVKGARGLWKLTDAGATAIKNHGKWGKFYKGSDGFWWSKDITQHGASKFKVFKETNIGLEWIHNADKYGDFIKNQHKSPTGTSIPWGQLKTIK